MLHAPGRALRAPAVALALACLVFSTAATALNTDFVGEYMRRIKVYQTIQPLGDTPFGESINLYTGEVSFLHTDIELPGTGPTIVISRQYHPQTQFWNGMGTFGDWALSIPRIETYVPAESRVSLGAPADRWQVETSPNGGAPARSRCTNFDWPYDLDESQSLWWQGYELIDERGRRQQLLRRLPEYTAKPVFRLSPEGAPIEFPAVTQDRWQIGCLPEIKNPRANSQDGEAFVGISPDGTRYFFNYLVGMRATTVIEYDQFAPKGIVHHPRMLAILYVSRIEDRFGNFVDYEYTGDKLTRIAASDGRVVTIAWNSEPKTRVITSITAMPGTPDARTWKYEYPDGRLRFVELPDASRWQFNLGAAPRGLVYSSNTCTWRTTSLITDHAGAVTVGITAPSGLVGTFTYASTFHGRSYVPSECRASSTFDAYEENIPIFSTPALTQKTISGAGLTPATWTYAYSPVQASTTSDACAATNNCPDRRWVEVTEPSGARTRYAISNRFNWLEGKTLETQTFDANGMELRREVLTYALPGEGGQYPGQLGTTMQDWHGNNSKSEVWAPVKQRMIYQQGRSFTWEAQTFDAFAQPLRVVRSSVDDAVTPAVVAAQPTPPPAPPVTTAHPMPLTLDGYFETDATVHPPLNTYTIYWTAVPGAVRYEARQGASNIIYSGPEFDASWDGRGEHNFWVRSCYADGVCSEWLGPLALGD